MMHDAVEPGRTPGIGGGKVRPEPLGEDLGSAVRPDATETTDADIEGDASPGNRQVRQGAGVVAMDSRRGPIAARAPGGCRDRPGCDGQHGADLGMIYDEAARDDGTSMQTARHDRISDDESRDPSTRLHRM
jgi:hypothetical protein